MIWNFHPLLELDSFLISTRVTHWDAILNVFVTTTQFVYIEDPEEHASLNLDTDTSNTATVKNNLSTFIAYYANCRMGISWLPCSKNDHPFFWVTNRSQVMIYTISAALNSQIFLQENSVVALIACGQEDSKCLERSCWMGLWIKSIEFFTVHKNRSISDARWPLWIFMSKYTRAYEIPQSCTTLVIISNLHMYSILLCGGILDSW